MGIARVEIMNSGRRHDGPGRSISLPIAMVQYLQKHSSLLPSPPLQNTAFNTHRRPPLPSIHPPFTYASLAQYVHKNVDSPHGL